MRSVLLLMLLSVAVTQVCWARCICDPSDRLCLDSCVDNARDCIEGCRNTLCFTDCINTHWPGAIFEDANDGNQEEYETSATVSEDKVPTKTRPGPISEQQELSSAIAVSSSSALNGLSSTDNGETNSAQETLTKETSAMIISTVASTASLPGASSLLVTSDMPFTTTHITITRLISITPTPLSSLMSSNATHRISRGSSLSDINQINLWITVFFLLGTAYILI